MQLLFVAGHTIICVDPEDVEVLLELLEHALTLFNFLFTGDDVTLFLDHCVLKLLCCVLEFADSIVEVSVDLLLRLFKHSARVLGISLQVGQFLSDFIVRFVLFCLEVEQLIQLLTVVVKLDLQGTSLADGIE